MRYLFAVMLTLAILIVPTAYAFWPFPDEQEPTITKYQNHDITQIEPSTYIWTSTPARMQDGGSWINYKYDDNDQYFIFESANGAITFSKESCGIKFFDPGTVLAGETPLIPSITHTEKQAVNGTDTWEPTTLNSKQCDFSYAITERGLELTAKKSSILFGFGEEYFTVYKIDYSGMVEIIYRHYNADPAKNDYKYGFTQSLDGDFKVKIGDITYDTAAIPDEIQFSKNDLDAKTITISKNGITILYDPENHIHDYLWALKIRPHHMNIDFTHAKGPLGFGNTLEVDPTFGYTAATDKRVATNTAAGACPTTTYTASAVSHIYSVIYDTADAAGLCADSMPRWDISSIPSTATITDVSVRYDVDTTTNMGARTCGWYPMQFDPSTATARNNYFDAQNGTAYTTETQCRTIATDKIVDLGSSADANVQSAVSSAQGWWSTGFTITPLTRDGTTSLVSDSTVGHSTDLQITYTLPPQTIALKPMQSDNSTSVGSGWIQQKNTTVTTLKTLNGTQYAVFPSTTLFSNYNYTFKDALDNFVTNYTINKAITANFNKQGPVNIYPVSCDANPDYDEQVKVNFTSYHNMTYWTTPHCGSNDDITALLRFVKQGFGPATNATTKIIMRVLDTANYGYSPSKVLWNGTSLPFTFTDNVMNATGAQVANGYNSVRYNLQIITDNVTSAPTGLAATPSADTQITLSWTAPTAIHGDAVVGYRIWRDNAILENDTASVVVSYIDTAAGPSGTSHTYMVCAWNRIGCSPYSSQVSGTTFRITTGTVTTDTEVVGDTLQANTTISITHASPTPVTVSALQLYRNGTLQETKVVAISIANGSSSSNFDPFWNRITTGDLYSYIIRATVSNSTGTVILSSANFTAVREYDPSYFNAQTNPTVEGQVNYTLARFNSEDGIHLQVNRVGGTLGGTWTINCITQTNAEAQATRNQSLTWPGTWRNFTNVGYFNSTWTGFANSQGYVTCINPPGILFTTTSFTNSSLALFGIAVFDASYGSMLGVPVGIFFLALAGGMANKRTAPTWIVVLLGMAGVMATIGFFTISPIIWGVALITGLLGLLVNSKVF